VRANCSNFQISLDCTVMNDMRFIVLHNIVLYTLGNLRGTLKMIWHLLTSNWVAYLVASFVNVENDLRSYLSLVVTKCSGES